MPLLIIMSVWVSGIDKQDVTKARKNSDKVAQCNVKQVLLHKKNVHVNHMTQWEFSDNKVTTVK